MKDITLTSKEQQEPLMVTIGRLRVAIKDKSSVERQLALFEKIVKEVEVLELQSLNKDSYELNKYLQEDMLEASATGN